MPSFNYDFPYGTKKLPVFASNVVASSQHLAAAYFEQVAGVEMTHVPYRNIAQYVPDLIAGSVQTGFQFLPNVSTPLKTGDAIALAVTSPTRMSALPDVPTAREAGLPGYETYGWLALLAPKDTPRAIIDRLNAEVAAAIKDETVKARLRICTSAGVTTGATSMSSNPCEPTRNTARSVTNSAIWPRRRPMLAL